MPVELRYEKCCLTALLSGEIDHHSAAFLRGEIDAALARLHPPLLCLDFDGVTFMDSSAVGLVMGRYKYLRGFDGALEVVNLSPAAYRMMRLSNLQSLAKLAQKQPEKREKVQP
ncbi:MAG: STAS domain-containing protein [Oscillospiraceae bacterium]|jgi:stage II sporulation protein AA (anti-sigma F factor antagonist)|nr:STAS domain-containing protein [Oscillospiraceae bacterium]